MFEVEVQESGATGPRMGEGEFPAEFNRLNWSTVLWGGLWAIVYAAWTWVLALFLLGLFQVGVFALVWRFAGPSSILMLVVAVLMQLAWYGLIITLAFRANRHVWERERRRVERESDQSVPRPAVPVSVYVASQRKWAKIGLGFLVLSTVFTLSTPQQPELFGQQLAGVLTTAFVLGALVVQQRIAQQRRVSQS